MFLFKLNSLINVANSIFFLVNKTNNFFDSSFILNELELSLFVEFKRKGLLDIVLFTKTQATSTFSSTSDLRISI